jgi:hypothetical protein
MGIITAQTRSDLPYDIFLFPGIYGNYRHLRSSPCSDVIRKAYASSSPLPVIFITFHEGPLFFSDRGEENNLKVNPEESLGESSGNVTEKILKTKKNYGLVVLIAYAQNLPHACGDPVTQTGSPSERLLIAIPG